VDWRTYRPLYLGAEVPRIETVLINQTDVPAMGAGETAVTVSVAAIGNAVLTPPARGFAKCPSRRSVSKRRSKRGS
jgi:CO/xanthine dehydrogenase Mo-binding subunit